MVRQGQQLISTQGRLRDAEFFVNIFVGNNVYHVHAWHAVDVLLECNGRWLRSATLQVEHRTDSLPRYKCERSKVCAKQSVPRHSRRGNVDRQCIDRSEEHTSELQSRQ